MEKDKFYFSQKIGINEVRLTYHKKCCEVPRCRVGEAPRAHPKGLARLPNIYISEVYQA